MAQRHQQPRAGQIGAPAQRIILAHAGQPAFDQILRRAPRGLAIGQDRQIAQPFPAMRPFQPLRRRAGFAEIDVPRHLRMTGVDQAAGDDALTDMGVAGHRIGRRSQQFQRKAAAQAKAVQRRGIEPRREPRSQFLR